MNFKAIPMFVALIYALMINTNVLMAKTGLNFSECSRLLSYREIQSTENFSIEKFLAAYRWILSELGKDVFRAEDLRTILNARPMSLDVFFSLPENGSLKFGQIKEALGDLEERLAIHLATSEQALRLKVVAELTEIVRQVLSERENFVVTLHNEIQTRHAIPAAYVDLNSPFTSNVTHLDFSTHGIAAISKNRFAVWSDPLKNRVPFWSNPGFPLKAAFLLSDKKTVLVISNTGRVHWVRDHLSFTFEPTPERITAFALSPNREKILLGTENGIFYIIERRLLTQNSRWDLPLVLRVEQHQIPGIGVITALALLPYNRMLYTHEKSGSLYIWDLHQKQGQKTAPGIYNYSIEVVVSNDGRLIAARKKSETGSSVMTSYELELRELNENTSDFKWRRKLGRDFTGSMAMSPNGKWVATSFADNLRHGHNKTIIWDVATGKKQYIFSHDVSLWPFDSMSFSPDNSHLAIARYDGKIRVWDIDVFAEESGK